MYDPKGNGKDRAAPDVGFVEEAPPERLQGIVHRYLELQTNGTLEDDYRFHALPDACTYIVFDQLDRRISGVAQLRATSEEFNLGRAFHFINIRLLPGVWRGAPEEVTRGIVQAPYSGALPLRELNEALAHGTFQDALPLLEGFVDTLVEQGLVAPNPVTEAILQNIDAITTVANMAELAGLSPRQLQRRLKGETGFSPHDLLKVLRLQQTLGGGDIWSYADQSHFIHSFRRATGYTPGKYARKFDV